MIQATGQIARAVFTMTCLAVGLHADAQQTWYKYSAVAPEEASAAMSRATVKSRPGTITSCKYQADDDASLSKPVLCQRLSLNVATNRYVPAGDAFWSEPPIHVESASSILLKQGIILFEDAVEAVKDMVGITGKSATLEAPLAASSDTTGLLMVTPFQPNTSDSTVFIAPPTATATLPPKPTATRVPSKTPPQNFVTDLAEALKTVQEGTTLGARGEFSASDSPQADNQCFVRRQAFDRCVYQCNVQSGIFGPSTMDVKENNRRAVAKNRCVDQCPAACKDTPVRTKSSQ